MYSGSQIAQSSFSRFHRHHPRAHADWRRLGQHCGEDSGSKQQRQPCTRPASAASAVHSPSNRSVSWCARWPVCTPPPPSPSRLSRLDLASLPNASFPFALSLARSLACSFFLQGSTKSWHMRKPDRPPRSRSPPRTPSIPPAIAATAANCQLLPPARTTVEA